MRVAVTGGGVGGLSVAARLAGAGFRVDLFDAGEKTGGKMGEVRLPADGEGARELRWDTGPTLLTLPDEIRATCDELLVDGVEPPALLPLNHGTHLRFSDGTDWRLPAPGASLAPFLESAGAPLSTELPPLLDLAREVFGFADAHVLGVEPPSLVGLGLKTLTTGISLRHPDLARQSYKAFVDARLSDPRARELFYHFCSYVGILPEHATASLVSIAHVELGMPVVFPRGGLAGLARYLEAACEARGVVVRRGARVASARPTGVRGNATVKDDARATGWDVEVAGYEGATRYDALVVACDPHQALVDWLDSPTTRRAWYADLVDGRLAPSESQFVVLFERAETSPLSHHVKLFPPSWLTSYRETVTRLRVPDEPCVYLVWPHATDPTFPAESLFLSAMAPSLDSGDSWDEAQCAAYAVRTLEAARRGLDRALPGRVRATVSPLDLYRRTGSLRGGLYGASPTRYSAAHFARPSQGKVPRLFFVGGGVHPGAGVPMVLKGARRVAAAVTARARAGFGP